MTKMAVYQPRRAAIAIMLVAVMQDDIREELLGRHKRGRTKEWIRRREEKGMYRLVEELRAEDTVAYKEMMRMNCETFSEILMAIEPALVTPADRKTIMHYHPLGQTEKTIMNYHVEFEHVQTA